MRIAFFTDSYLEVNGVAMTSKRLENFASRRDYPFLTVHAGVKTEKTVSGSVTRQELKRSFLKVNMDGDLAFDPTFMRHVKLMRRVLTEFKPDVVHITGLNDVSILGAYLAYRMNLPVLASWHTNIHEFGARRLDLAFRLLPENLRKPSIGFIESQILRGAVLYYKMGRVLLAPNQELIDMLQNGGNQKRPAYLMIRGVDTALFAPEKRTVDDDTFRFGFCGRLQPEKNVRLLADLEKSLLAAGKTNFKFVLIGEGSERAWLEQNMQQAEITGFIAGEQLSETYANLDVFVFPSETDAFGNVVQEAHASGVPAIVSNVGGPKFIVHHGENGFVCKDLADYTRAALELMDNPALLAEMRGKARNFALSRSWDSVFESVYRAYDVCRRRQTNLPNPKLSVASTP